MLLPRRRSPSCASALLEFGTEQTAKAGGVGGCQRTRLTGTVSASKPVDNSWERQELRQLRKVFLFSSSCYGEERRLQRREVMRPPVAVKLQPVERGKGGSRFPTPPARLENTALLIRRVPGATNPRPKPAQLCQPADQAGPAAHGRARNCPVPRRSPSCGCFHSHPLRVAAAAGAALRSPAVLLPSLTTSLRQRRKLAHRNLSLRERFNKVTRSRSGSEPRSRR